MTNVSERAKIREMTAEEVEAYFYQHFGNVKVEYTLDNINILDLLDKQYQQLTGNKLF